MRYDPDKHHRRSIRLKGYDYRWAGAYFVTVCTHNRECLLGEIVDGQMRLNELGEIVWEEWFRSAEIRQEIELMPDEFVVMPNHVHGIIVLTDLPIGARHAVPGSIPTIIRSFKSATTGGNGNDKAGMAESKYGRSDSERACWRNFLGSTG